MSITEELIEAARTTPSIKTGGVTKKGIWDGPGDLNFLSLAASLALRKLVFWTLFVAAIVIHTSKQTVDDISHGTSKTAKYTQHPAYEYLLIVLWIAFVYTFLACLSSFICGRRRNGNKAFLLRLVKWDAIVLTLLASAAGTAGSVLYIATKGNPYNEWSSTCDVFDKFCRHMWASFGLSLFACSLYLWIIIYQLAPYELLHCPAPSDYDKFSSGPRECC